jgi:2-phosphoglycolate phosphatase
MSVKVERQSIFDAVLFDLDGTLIDTAPDMVAVLIDMLESEGRDPIDYRLARSQVSNGSAGLIRLGFPDVSESRHERLRLEYLDRYEKSVCVNSKLFAGLEDLLNQFDDHDRPWGVVTNKPARMTEPLLAALGLSHRIACQISGDTIPERKPDPAPLLLACKKTGVAPSRSVYIGDASRDIQAGKAAGLFTIAAAYGYITEGDDIAAWNADHLVQNVQELTTMLRKGANLDAS